MKFKKIKSDNEVNVKDWVNRQNPEFIQRIIDDHYVLLNSVANKYSRHNQIFNKEDLIAEGSIGLLRAIQTFEPKKNIKFSTYAYFWIKNKILGFINSQHNIKSSKYDKSSRIVYNLDIANTPISNQSFEKNINIDEENLETQYLQAFDIFLSGLSEINKHVLLERIKGNITLSELAQKLNRSRETIRQIEIQQINNFKFFLKNVIKLEDINAFITISLLFIMII